MRELWLILLLLALPVMAALPPLDQQERIEHSDLICEAQVLSVSRQKKFVKNGFNYHYNLELKILDVRKGELAQKQLQVFFKTTGARPSGWAGPQGQNRVPSKGVIGLFYLRGGSGQYSLLEPNGWEPQPE